VHASPSHLIVHVVDTDATVAFYRTFFDAEVRDDHEMTSPSLDAIFGREGVRIRSTFLHVAGYVLHTIETLDVARTKPAPPPSPPIGVTGMSFTVDDLDAAHALAEEKGWNPTAIYRFENTSRGPLTRLFFVPDPDGLRVELVEFSS
jgi:glyoxylase I family protein